MTTCKKCGKEGEFRKQRNTCKRCESAYGTQWNKDNADKHNLQSKQSYHRKKESYRDRKKNEALRRRYGITLDDYRRMFEEQGGKCYICHTHQSRLGKPLSVDHHHTTGKIRRLLCVKCNSGLGNFQENTSLLRKAVAYLKEFS